jgi:hypothetical protein
MGRQLACRPISDLCFPVWATVALSSHICDNWRSGHPSHCGGLQGCHQLIDSWRHQVKKWPRVQTNPKYEHQQGDHDYDLAHL